MDYNKLTKDQLIQRVYELEVLTKELLKQEEQEATLDFCWAGNLGHWYWNVPANKVTFNPLKITTLGYTKDEIPTTFDYEFLGPKRRFAWGLRVPRARAKIKYRAYRTS